METSLLSSPNSFVFVSETEREGDLCISYERDYIFHVSSFVTQDDDASFFIVYFSYVKVRV